MNNPLGVSPCKGNQGTTRGKERNLLTSVGIEPTTCATLRVVFSTLFSVSGKIVKYSLSSLICYFSILTVLLAGGNFSIRSKACQVKRRRSGVNERHKRGGKQDWVCQDRIQFSAASSLWTTTRNREKREVITGGICEFIKRLMNCSELKGIFNILLDSSEWALRMGSPS